MVNVYVRKSKVNLIEAMEQRKDHAHPVNINANRMEPVLSVLMIPNVKFWLTVVNRVTNVPSINASVVIPDLRATLQKAICALMASACVVLIYNVRMS